MKLRHRRHRVAAVVAWLLAAGIGSQAAGAPASEMVPGWAHAAGNDAGTRYSPLRQIDRRNAWRLERAWTWQDGKPRQPATANAGTGFHATPILLPDAAGGGLVACTPTNLLVSLDPVTGTERWRFDPGTPAPRAPEQQECRGIAYWHAGEAEDGDHCAHRIYSSADGRRVLAVDAIDGKPCGDFGDDGAVELRSAGPPVIVNGVLVAGELRAVDARTGKPRWHFDAGAEGGNPAGALSVDGKRDLVLVARPGSIAAVRGATGELAWSFTTVHQDAWNRGPPAQPILADIHRDGRMVPAVIVLTSQSLVFVLDRETGKPLIPVEERAVPGGGAEAGSVPATQPFPARPPPLLDTTLTPADAWGLTFWDQERCQELIEGAAHIGLYPPPGVAGSIIYPGPAGGSHRVNGAWDPTRNLLVTGLSQVGARLESLPRGGIGPQPFLGPAGLPCTRPPWARLVGVDLATGEIRWTAPLGAVDRLASLVVPPLRWGTPVSGGPIVTAGDIVLIGATGDGRLRAFDTESGAEVWSTRLPAPAHAMPMTYERNGRQFVVIAAGAADEWLLAYALPEKFLESPRAPD